MIRDLQATIRTHWRVVVGLPATVGVLVVAYGLLTPRSYQGDVVVSPVTSASDVSGAGLAASVLGAAAVGGLHSTPILVSRLARLDGVLFKVASEPVDDRGLRVVDRLRKKAAGKVSDRQALEEMRRTVSSTADPQSGLVVISVVAKDSALVRLIAEKILAYTSAAFVGAMRTQASALKHAQDARVESARMGLSQAEDAMLAWRKANREPSEYADASLTARRLERNLRVAEQLYLQVVTQRETAASRELDETPALVVVDALPDRLRPRSRGLLLLSTLWASFTFVTVVCLLVAWPRLTREAGPAALAISGSSSGGL